MLLQEARLKSREIVLEAETERERVLAQIRRLQTDRSELQASYRAFLQGALERLDRELEKPDAAPELPDADEEPEPELGASEENTDVSLFRGGQAQDEGPDEAPSDETERPTRVA
jgi:hypothetical protein